jgi:hypothetical protein
LHAVNVQQEISKMSEKHSGAVMRDLVAAAAGPRQWNDTRESWLARAARNAGVSYRQAKALFYGEITDDEHKTVRRMRAAAGRHEAAELAHRYEALASTYHLRDEDLLRSDVAAFIDAVRALRGLGRSGNNGED